MGELRGYRYFRQRPQSAMDGLTDAKRGSHFGFRYRDVTRGRQASRSLIAHHLAEVGPAVVGSDVFPRGGFSRVHESGVRRASFAAR